MRSRAVVLSFALSLLFILFPARERVSCEEASKLIVFHSLGCNRCVQAKAEVMPGIEREFKGRVEIQYLNIDEIENYKYMLSLKEKHGSDIRLDLPVFFFAGGFVNGIGDIKRNLTDLITNSLAAGYKQEQLPQIDLIERFKSFTPLAITGAGLIDGINPCAFTVIVFFISFLALQGYRKRELLAIGLCFISAVALTYILIGLGLFGFLYKMEAFWRIAKVLNFFIGIFSIILGFLSIHDFLEYKKTNRAEGLALQLPIAVKNQIHRVIGMYYRRDKRENQKPRKHILNLAATAFVTGFLVSILEAVCTGQTYLPTIGFILKATHLKLQALSYLVLYNFMFIVPLLAIFFFSLLGVSSEQFSNFLKKRLLAIKALMAILFFGLGIFLIWRA